MTTQDLFRCIGDLSDTMIEEAADIRRKKRWLPIAALAACAVLAISIPLAVRSANSTKSASTADTSAAESPAAEAPAEADSAVGAPESPREPAVGKTATRSRHAFSARRSAGCGWG